MAFKSEAHKKKLEDLLAKGKISKATFEDHKKQTGTAKLPERVEKPAKTVSLIKRRHTPV